MYAKGNVLDYQVQECTDAVARYISSHGKCQREVFKVLVESYLDPGAIQRIGVTAYLKKGTSDNQKKNAAKLLNGDDVGKSKMKFFREFGLSYIVSSILRYKRFKKLPCGNYTLNETEGAFDKPSGTRICTKCKQELSNNAFAWNNKARGELCYSCKKCRSVYNRKKRTTLDAVSP